MDSQHVDHFGSAQPVVVSVAVAIPAMNEAQRIEGCLMALQRQDRLPEAVVLLLNNCTDATEPIARELAPRLRYPLHIETCDLPPSRANAGYARRAAMELAAAHAGPYGVLMTTDADAIVPGDWIARNLTALCYGVDAVCGRAIIDPADLDRISPRVRADEALEGRLITLLDQVSWLLDPDPYDPLPRHTEHSGASLAVSVAAWRFAGGIPPVASGEDRYFIEALRRIDARVRHDPAISVMVSGRTDGRAEGGMAEALRRRSARRDVFADERAEPASDAYRRYEMRARARFAWRLRRVDLRLAADLRVDPSLLESLSTAAHFGQAWVSLEQASPVLRRRRVVFADIEAEIERAEALLRSLAPSEVMAAD